MGSRYRVVVGLPYIGVFTGTEIAENTLTVQWMGAGDPTDFDFEQATVDIGNLYNHTTADPAGTIAAYLSNRINRDADGAFVDFYRIPGAPGDFGPPVASKVFTLGDHSPGTVSLPNQLALCLSFNADLAGFPERSGATRPRARRRGRIYLGPLNINTLGPSLSDFEREVNHNFVATAGQSAHVMGNALLLHDWQWQVFSEVDWTGRPVVAGWVDDRFDTIRGRVDDTRNKTPWVV